MKAHPWFNMPAMNGCIAYPEGPYRFVNRELFIIEYETDLKFLIGALHYNKVCVAQTAMGYKYQSPPAESVLWPWLLTCPLSAFSQRPIFFLI
jgi:acetoacetate decarboxylase